MVMKTWHEYNTEIFDGFFLIIIRLGPLFSLVDRSKHSKTDVCQSDVSLSTTSLYVNNLKLPETDIAQRMCIDP